MKNASLSLWVLITFAGADARAAGTSGGWSQCGLPARLAANPAGRTAYVATWGTNPSSCPSWSGYTFRTIDGAVRCAKGNDTIYVHGGTYGPVGITNLWPSAQVLVTNYPGESPVIDGWSSVGDYGAILWVWNATNLAFQGLTIQNTGVPDAEHGGYGVKVDNSTHIKFYYNTIRNTARHGVLTDGHSNEVVGNEISQTVMRNRWKTSNYWDAAYASHPNHQQWGLKVLANSVHDSYGECVDIFSVDGATVEGNQVYNCLSGNIYVSNARNVTVNRNWLFANTDSYNKPNQPWRAPGITIANEGQSTGFQVANVRVTNNIVERLSQAFRYWRSHSGTSIQDSYANLYVAFNTFARLQTWPIRLDGTEGSPQGWNQLRQNIVINTSGWDWYSNVTPVNWGVANNWPYTSGYTGNTPGLEDPGGGWAGAYQLKDGAALRWVVPPRSEPGMPWDDFHCHWRNPDDWGPAGASM